MRFFPLKYPKISWICSMFQKISWNRSAKYLLLFERIGKVFQGGRKKIALWYMETFFFKLFFYHRETIFARRIWYTFDGSVYAGEYERTSSCAKNCMPNLHIWNYSRNFSKFAQCESGPYHSKTFNMGLRFDNTPLRRPGPTRIAYAYICMCACGLRPSQIGIHFSISYILLWVPSKWIFESRRCSRGSQP